MKIKVVNKSILDFDGDLVIVNLFEGVKKPGGATGAVDRAMGGAISRAINNGEITGKRGETLIIHTLDKIKARRVMVVGLGKPNAFGLESIRKAAGAAALAAKKAHLKTIAMIVHGAGIGGIDPEQGARAAVEGTILALYEFTEYKKPEMTGIGSISIFESDRGKYPAIKHGVETGRIIAEAQNTSRDLSNEPANNLTPVLLGRRIKAFLKEQRLDKKIACTILGPRELALKRLGALLSVSQGSDHEPQFITLRYKKSDRPLICLIGKTVTFDSGGISLKDPEGMQRMKGDMSGGGVVFAVMAALARTGSKVNVMALIPAVENMPSGSASRPGDVVRAMNGKTIEIISTDAEGRMTLADAICYAESRGAKVIVDIATLTGGSMIAFGDITAAVMGNDARLIEKLLTITHETGERMWELPLFEEYEEKIKSDVADLKNSGGRGGAPITAGIFLKAFVKDARWVHIDIAGKEFADSERFYQPKTATGFGVRTLFEFCRQI
ncbi:MAG TPA: leucyl aminopeptidase [bacterium]